MGWDTVTLYEAFYEHSFMDGDLSLLAGLHDYNSEFYALDYSLTLLNSSFGFGPELSQIVNSTYPVTAAALRARYQPTENSYVLAAAYDGVPGRQGDYQGTHIILDRSDGIFYAAEVGLTSTEEDTPSHYYKLALGGWYRSTDYTDYSDVTRGNDKGAYLIGERKIFSEEDPKQGLGIFGQFGKTQGDRNFIATYYGAGLHYTGLIPDRDDDITTVGVASAHHGGQYKGFDQGAATAETAFEFSYRAPIAYGLTLQPDIQYIMNPGLQKDLNHALVLGSRVEVMF
jgi:porin